METMRDGPSCLRGAGRFCIGRAVAAIPVKVASSVGTSEQNYVNVTYGKLVELAQKYSGGAFEFQLYPDMRLGDNRRPSARSSTAISRCPAGDE